MRGYLSGYFFMYRIIALLLVWCLCHAHVSAQFSIDNGDVTLCTGTFVDDGLAGPYSDNNYVITICPDIPGDAVSVVFTMFDLQTNANPNNNDILLLYDGNTTGAPLVGAPSGNAMEGISITASEDNPTGCLTFQLIVNNGASGGNAGWEGVVGCTTPCGVPISQLALVSPPAFPDAPSSVGICPGDAVQVDGSSSQPSDGGPALASWIWNWGDGEVEITNTPQASHVYNETGEFIITLFVEDELGCSNVNLDPVQVLVSPAPEFNTVFPETVCVNSPAVIDGTGFQSGTWTSLVPPLISEDEALPDDLGVPFVSPMPVDFFDTGAEVESCEDILSITASLHHTFIGDLTITLECPNGQEMLLLENGASGGEDPSGCMWPDLGGTNLGNPPNDAWDYTWSDDADFIIDDPDNPAVQGVNAVPEGEYLPCGSFCDLIGCPLNGIWNLVIVDNWGGDQGYLEGWTLEFDPTLVPDVTTISPSIGLGIDSSYWDVTLGEDGVQDIDFQADILNLQFDAPGLYDYTFVLTNSFGCVYDTTIVMEVIEGPSSNITAGPDQVFCGAPVVLEGEFNTTVPSPCSASQGTETVCYGNGANDVYTYCPDNPGDGTLMSLQFFDGQIEACVFDEINVFDGPDINSPLLTTLCGIYAATNVEATNPDGCLTVQITSDGSVSCESGAYDPVSWCVGCGGEDVCGFTWSWEPPDNLDDPFATQPTVLDFDGTPTEYVVFVEPIGFENCAATDTVLVVPGFEYVTDYSDPTCLITDGEITITISEPAADGPWEVVLSNVTGIVEDVSYGGGLQAFEDLEAGQYTLEVSDQTGCSYTTEFDLADPEPPGITVSEDVVICIDGTATLTAVADFGGPYAFNWTAYGQPVAQGGTILVGPEGTTVYEVQGVDGAGCVTQPGAVTVGIYDAFTVDIDADDLICLGDEVLLSAINVTGGEGNGYAYEFSYGGVTYAAGAEDQSQFVPPLTGDFCVTVSEACSTPTVTACMEVEVEQPFDLHLAADTTRGCVPQNLIFAHDLPAPLVDSQFWDFGDDGTSASAGPIHTYAEPGVFDVSVTVVTTTGCVNTVIVDNYIQIFTPPSVGFDAGPQPTTAPDTRIDFNSSVSPNVVNWNWSFIPGDLEAVSFEPDPTFTFPMGNGGIYPVTLTVVDTNGCQSAVTREVEIFDFFNVFIPNSFTPNNDGFNDIWAVYGSDIDPDRFEMTIYNRWGQLVFETTDPEEGWIGQADDEMLPEQWYFAQDGIFAYRVVLYSESTNEKREIKGYLNLSR